MTEGTRLPDAGVGYVMLFNILYAEDPRRLPREAYRILAPDGIAAVMHWVSDRPTSAGPLARHTPTPGGLPEMDDCRGTHGSPDRLTLTTTSLDRIVPLCVPRGTERESRPFRAGSLRSFD